MLSVNLGPHFTEEREFEEAYDRGDLDDAYSEYIMANCAGDRLICNGDMLIGAIEDGYLFENFKNEMVR